MNNNNRVVGCVAMLAMVGCSAPSVARSSRITTYECSGGRAFTVHRGHDTATVDYEERSYELSRRASSMGVRYSADGASLIVDGDVAVFVTERVLDLKVCQAVKA